MRPRHLHRTCFAVGIAMALALGGSRARAKDSDERLVPHLDVRLRWSDGQIAASAITMGRGEHREKPGSAAVAHRFETRGRYQARVEVAGKTLGDPVRFDFPLLADADAGNAEALNDEMRKHVTSETTIRLPLPPSEARALVIISDDKTKHDLRVVIPSPLAESGTAPPPSAAPVPPAPRAVRSAPAPFQRSTQPLWHPAAQTPTAPPPALP